MTTRPTIHKCPRCSLPMVKAGPIYIGGEWVQKYECTRKRDGTGCGKKTHKV